METVVYNDFSGGWSGNLDLAKIPANMYDAKNMLLYRDGFIGPRPGLKSLSLGRTTAGEVKGVLLQNFDSSNGLLYVDDNHVYVSPSEGGSSTDLGEIFPGGSVAAFPYFMLREDANTSYILARSNLFAGFSDDYGSAQQLDADSDAFFFPSGVVYGERFVRGGELDTIFYSPPSTFDVWVDSDSTNNITLRTHSGAKVVHIAFLKNNLVIVDEEGRFFILSGVPGVNDTLRMVSGLSVTPNPLPMLGFVSTDDNTLHYLSPNNNCPAAFDGVSHSEMYYLSLTPNDSLNSYADQPFAVVHNDIVGFLGRDRDSVGFFSSTVGTMLLQQYGAWGYHDFTVEMSNIWTTSAHGVLYGFSQYTTDGSMVLNAMDLRLNRPANATDSFARPGDNSNTPVDAEITFPEIWSEDGYLLKPTELVVDIKKWNLGTDMNNRVQAEVVSLARGFKPSINMGTQSRTWEQATSEAGDGEKDRLRWNLDGQEGAGIRVRLYGLRGVAIGEVRVNYEKVIADARYG